MNGGIICLSRIEAVKKNDWDKYQRPVMIAIRTPGDPPLEYNKGVFVAAEIYCHDVSLSEYEKQKKEGILLTPFNKDHAKICCLAFLIAIAEESDIFIHCDMGVSRSRGVAAGLLEGIAREANDPDVTEETRRAIAALYQGGHPNIDVKNLVREEAESLIRKMKRVDGLI